MLNRTALRLRKRITTTPELTGLAAIADKSATHVDLLLKAWSKAQNEALLRSQLSRTLAATFGGLFFAPGALQRTSPSCQDS